jgi:hypothetical protein
MTIKDILHFGKILGGKFLENSPIILTGAAVTGVISTGILAVKATPRALKILEEERRKRDEYEKVIARDGDGREIILAKGDTLTNREVVQLVWKCYIPATGMCLGTIACIIGAHKVNQRRNAALMGLYSLSEVAFKEYKEKVAETIGKVKEQRIRDEIDADHIKANPPNSAQVIFTGKGDVMCYDSLTGRYFRSDIEKIRRTVNELNRRLMSEMFLDLNDLYFELGIPTTKLGDELGFNLDDGLLEINFSSAITDDGQPCLVLNYEVVPKYK